MKILNRRLAYALLTVFVVLGVIALIAIKGPLSPIPVKVTRLQQGELHPGVFGIGTVEARRSYSIGPTRAGRLMTLLVDHGDSVKKGQLLGEMAPVDLSARLNSAQLMVEKTEHLVESAQAAVDEAKSRALQAQQESLRYKSLLAQKQVSLDVAENKATEALVAADKVREAEANLAGVRHDLERSHEDVKALQAQLDDLKLLSPADGLITAREVEPGSVVVAGTSVLRMIEPASLWVRARIDQARSGQLHQGQAALIQLRNLPGQALTGRVERIELIADSLTEERWVDVGFDSRPADLSIGMLATVTIELPEVKQAMWLPGAAIVHQQGSPGVWRLIDGKAEFTPLQIGVQTLDGKTQVISGLNAQDSVVEYAMKPIKAGGRVKEISDD